MKPDSRSAMAEVLSTRWLPRARRVAKFLLSSVKVLAQRARWGVSAAMAARKKWRGGGMG